MSTRISTAFYFALIYLIPFALHAQFFSAGEDPASVRWMQVKEDRIRIIFPEGHETQARYVLENLKELKKKAVHTLASNIPAIDVVLHNQTAEANGFVTWAPKRMELFTQPDQGTYPQDWLQQLSIHEFRHVVQISNMRQGLTKVLSMLLGEQAVGAVLGMYVPLWFLEGDAVTFETAYSRTGRGRTPSFFTPYLSMMDQYGGFCYEKITFGSYKHFVPNHYVTGYHLISFSRYYYGPQIWKSVLDNVARRPYMIVPFSTRLKKWTGMSRFDWYNWSAAKIDAMYTDKIVCVKHVATDFTEHHKNNDFVSYRFPQYLNDSTIVTEKSGLSHVKEWVLIHRDGSEKSIQYPGYYSIFNTSISGDKLYYTEYRFDKRWTHRRWSEVMALDVRSKKKKRISHKTYAASPVVSKGGDRIAYLEQDVQGIFSLTVQHLLSQERRSFSAPAGQMLYTPAWESDSTLVCIVLDKEQGKYFSRLHLDRGTWEHLSEPSFYDMNQPVVWNGYILHRGAYESREQIYAYHVQAKKLYRVSRELYEATDPSVSEGKLAFASYTATGYVVKEQMLDTLEWIEVEPKGKQWDNVITRAISQQELTTEIKRGVPVSDSTASSVISRYRKGTHLFNFHSWAPVYVDVDNANVHSGGSLFSQNILSTSFLSLGYLHDNTEQTGKWIADYKYTGFYPVLSLSASLGDRYMPRYGTWKEAILEAGIAVPFNLTHGPYTEKMTLSVLPRWQSIYQVDENNAGGLVDQDLLSLSYRFDYQRLFRMAPRDLRPLRGQSLFLQYRHAAMADFNYGSLISGSAGLWLPSLWKHHSVLTRVQGHYYEKGGAAYLSSPITFSRGYMYYFSPGLLRGSIDYAFPLCYPDWRLTALFYIKRIKINAFYDATWAFRNTNTTYYDSKGVDVRVDFHFANFLAPIDMGIRTYWLNENSNPYFQLLLTYLIN